MDMKKELLEALQMKLKADRSVEDISLFTAEELGAPMDMLRAKIGEFGPDLINVLGEFFFMPFEDEGILYFTTVITLSASLPKEAVPDMAAAAARLDYYLPFGCYALGDNDRNLIYRYTALLNENEEKEKLNASISTAAFGALSVAEKFIGYLLLVLKNEISVEEMVGMLLGTNNSNGSAQ